MNIFARGSRFLALFVLLALGTASAAPAAFPDHPIHILIGFEPGGTTDAVARLIGKFLSERWGQPVIVENRPGANGMIAADVAAHSAPDGYTLLMMQTTFTIAASEQKLNFDPINSFSPITRVALSSDLLLINPVNLKVNSLSEFMALVKSKPGQLNFGSPGGADTIQYLEMQLLMKKTGMNLVHVAYKGNGPAAVALLSNEVQLLPGSMSSNMAQVNAGKFKALAITSNKPSPLLPDVPTLADAANLPGFEITSFFGLVTTAGTPKDVVAKLHDAIIDSLNSPEIKKIYADQGTDPANDTPEAFAQVIKDNISQWAAVRRDSGVK